MEIDARRHEEMRQGQVRDIGTCTNSISLMGHAGISLVISSLQEDVCSTALHGTGNELTKKQIQEKPKAEVE